MLNCTVYDPLTGILITVPKSQVYTPVTNFAALPDPTTATGQTYQVLNSSGIWPFNNPAGLYYSNGTTWTRLGLTPTEIQTQIDAHATRTDNPHSVTKSQVGLDQVDNTSDLNKPISTATQLELDRIDLDVDQLQDIAFTFETISKNLKSWNTAINTNAGGDITSIVYTSGADVVTKTFNYTSGDLTSLVLSGDTPAGINLTKTFNYSSGDIVGWSYS